jgi:group I intron endonuclease
MGGTIYLIENLVNGHKYVGQTRVKLKQRLQHHYTESKRFTERPLYRAMKKYGIGNFKVKILQKCSIDELDEREKYWINFFNTFKDPQHYNCTEGGEGGEISEDTKQRIAKGMSLVPRGEKWEQSMSVSLKKKFESGEKWGFMNCHGDGKHARRRVRAIPQIKLSGNCRIKPVSDEILEFDCAKNAAEFLTGKRNTGAIAAAIKNGWIAYGYKWEKVDKTPIWRRVYGVHRETGEKTQYFNSIKEAARNWDKKDSGIRKSLKEPGVKSFMNHYWYFVDEKTE